MKRLLLTFSLFSALAFGQAAGVGSIWTYITGTLQSAATANGNGTALAVSGLGSAAMTVNCSVACSGGTTINFEGSQDGSNYVALQGVQLGTNTIAATVLNQGTTITVWELPIGSLSSIRARISAYSAGTITVTASASAAPYNPKVQNANTLVGGSAVDGNSGSKSAQTVRVAIATDQPALTNKLLVTPDANVKVDIVGNAGANVDAATGAAPPANALLVGGVTSGATGGFLTALPVCDSFANINISTATTTLLVTGVSGRHVRVCHIDMISAAANNVGIISGTGSTCGTGSAAIVGTTAATGYNLPANGGISSGSGLGTIMRTVATGDSVCLITSAATQLSGVIAYTIY